MGLVLDAATTPAIHAGINSQCVAFTDLPCSTQASSLILFAFVDAGRSPT